MCRDVMNSCHTSLYRVLTGCELAIHNVSYLLPSLNLPHYPRTYQPTVLTQCHCHSYFSYISWNLSIHTIMSAQLLAHLGVYHVIMTNCSNINVWNIHGQMPFFCMLCVLTICCMSFQPDTNLPELQSWPQVSNEITCMCHSVLFNALMNFEWILMYPAPF